jgi:hypothetical protein
VAQVLVHPGVSLQGGLDPLELERLDDVVHGAAAQHILHRLCILRGRHHDHIDRQFPAPQILEHLHAVQVGQVDIEDHEIRAKLIRDKDAFFAAAGGADHPEGAGRLHVGPVHLRDHGIILDDHNPILAHAGSAPSGVL